MPVTLSNTDYEKSTAAVRHLVEVPAPPVPPSDAPVVPQANPLPTATKVAADAELKRGQEAKAAADAAAKAAAAAPPPAAPGPKAVDQLSPMFGGPSKAAPKE